MKLKYIVIPALLILVGAGCSEVVKPIATDQRAAPRAPIVAQVQPPPKPSASMEYDFNCVQGKELARATNQILDSLLKASGLELTKDNGVSVCFPNKSMQSDLVIVKTSNCRADLYGKNNWCTQAVLVAVDLKLKTLKIMVKEDTGELLGNTIIDNDLLTWTKDYVTYRVRSGYGEGGCVEADIKNVYAYVDKVVSISTGNVSIEKKCRYTSCTSDLIVCAKD
ncbi:hypothetical protein HY065_01625 [Candidatus Berkelbacteria bacterium]|nr:hypothetical protein [Candidatus Berkelbacteria bacterium]